MTKIAPAKIVSSYELHCLDQLLKQVMDDKVPLRDSIADIKGILKNFDLKSPEVLEQINKKIQHRLEKYDTDTAARFAADLALQIEHDSGSESLLVIFNSVASKLLPDTCKNGMKSSFANAILKFGVDGARKDQLDELGKLFNASVAHSILQMQENFPSGERGSASAMKLFIERYIPSILSDALAGSALDSAEKKTQSLHKFIASHKAAEPRSSATVRMRRDMYDKELVGQVVQEARRLIVSKGDLEGVIDTDKVHISNAMEMLIVLRDTFEGGYDRDIPEVRNATSALIKKYATDNQSTTDKIMISGNVSAWLDEVQALAKNATDTLVKLESISPDFLISQAKASMLDNVHITIPRSSGNSATSKATIASPMSAAAEPEKIFGTAEKRAEEAQLITLIYRFIENKDRKYAAKRALMDPKKAVDKTATEKESSKLEKADSWIQFYLEEMKRNGASKKRMNSVARREKRRLELRRGVVEVEISKKTKEMENLKVSGTVSAEKGRLTFEKESLEREFADIEAKISSLNKFLGPDEDGGEYQANEFAEYFK